jgi:hypothetical protein
MCIEHSIFAARGSFRRGARIANMDGGFLREVAASGGATESDFSQGIHLVEGIAQ